VLCNPCHQNTRQKPPPLLPRIATAIAPPSPSPPPSRALTVLAAQARRHDGRIGVEGLDVGVKRRRQLHARVDARRKAAVLARALRVHLSMFGGCKRFGGPRAQRNRTHTRRPSETRLQTSEQQPHPNRPTTKRGNSRAGRGSPQGAWRTSRACGPRWAAPRSRRPARRRRPAPCCVLGVVIVRFGRDGKG
jgi:hypothetical protein